MEEVGPDQGQVLDPDQHVKVEGPPRLKLEAVKVCDHIAIQWLLLKTCWRHRLVFAPAR